MRPTLRFHIRDRAHKGEIAIGPGKIALLEAIETTGSITAAARQLGMSYRRAWLLVDETNRSLVQPAVKAEAGGKNGGGAQLTPTGIDLCRRYRAIERQVDAAVTRELRDLLRSRPRPGTAGRAREDDTR
jgi:molybdate transport system regulatory protein